MDEIQYNRRIPVLVLQHQHFSVVLESSLELMMQRLFELKSKQDKQLECGDSLNDCTTEYHFCGLSAVDDHTSFGGHSNQFIDE